jgi:hypothetical protein
MLKDIVILALGLGFGLGGVLMGLALPPLYPNAPLWVWRWLFWGGLALMLLMSIDIILLLKGGENLASYLPDAILYNAICIFGLLVLGLLYEGLLATPKGSIEFIANMHPKDLVRYLHKGAKWSEQFSDRSE